MWRVRTLTFCSRGESSPQTMKMTSEAWYFRSFTDVCLGHPFYSIRLHFFSPGPWCSLCEWLNWPLYCFFDSRINLTGKSVVFRAPIRLWEMRSTLAACRLERGTVSPAASVSDDWVSGSMVSSVLSSFTSASPLRRRREQWFDLSLLGAPDSLLPGDLSSCASEDSHLCSSGATWHPCPLQGCWPRSCNARVWICCEISLRHLLSLLSPSSGPLSLLIPCRIF